MAVTTTTREQHTLQRCVRLNEGKHWRYIQHFSYVTFNGSERYKSEAHCPAAGYLNTGPPSSSATHRLASAALNRPPLPTRMYVAGIMNHFSEAPKMELIVWGSTMAIFVSTAFEARSQLKSARSKAGDTKLASTGPRFWTSLAFLGQSAGLYLLPLVYWTTTASNKFHQPGWMTEYALPSPPDVFGFDGITVGRTVGLLGVLVGAKLTRTALKALGDQFSTFGVSALLFHGLSDVNRWLATFLRHVGKGEAGLVDHGPFTYIRHPIYAQVFHTPFAEQFTLRSSYTARALLSKLPSLLRSGRIFPSTPFHLRSLGAY